MLTSFLMDKFSNTLASVLDPTSRKALSHKAGMEALLMGLRQQEDALRLGGGTESNRRATQQAAADGAGKARLAARSRSRFLGIWAV